MVVVFGGFEMFTFGAFDVDQELGMMLYPYAHTPYPHVVIGWCQVQKGAELPISVTRMAKTFLKANRPP